MSLPIIFLRWSNITPTGLREKFFGAKQETL